MNEIKAFSAFLEVDENKVKAIVGGIAGEIIRQDPTIKEFFAAMSALGMLIEDMEGQVSSVKEFFQNVAGLGNVRFED